MRFVRAYSNILLIYPKLPCSHVWLRGGSFTGIHLLCNCWPFSFWLCFWANPHCHHLVNIKGKGGRSGVWTDKSFTRNTTQTFIIFNILKRGDVNLSPVLSHTDLNACLVIRKDVEFFVLLQCNGTKNTLTHAHTPLLLVLVSPDWITRSDRVKVPLGRYGN